MNPYNHKIYQEYFTKLGKPKNVQYVVNEMVIWLEI
jgi:hypothetical protein